MKVPGDDIFLGSGGAFPPVPLGEGGGGRPFGVVDPAEALLIRLGDEARLDPQNLGEE